MNEVPNTIQVAVRVFEAGYVDMTHLGAPIVLSHKGISAYEYCWYCGRHIDYIGQAGCILP